jgi:hypothetical protein
VLEGRGALEAIEETLEATAHPSQIEDHCNRLLDLWTRRLAIQKADQIKASASNPDTDLPKSFEQAAKTLSSGRSTATVRGSMDLMHEEIEEAAAGRRYVVPLPFPQLSRATRMMSPGKLAAICGAGGRGKSLMINQCLMYWQKSWKSAVLALEDSIGFHTRRGLAQITGDETMTKDESFLNPEFKARYYQLCQEHAEELEPFIRSLHKPHRDQRPTFEFALDWIRARASEGCRIIGIDPFTKLCQTPGVRLQMNHQQDEFIYEAINIVERYGCSFFVVTHPSKSSGPRRAKGEPQMEDLAGSAAIINHARCIIWYQGCPEKQMDCRVWAGGMEPSRVETRTVNRFIKIMKANESFGGGMRIGYDFDAKSLLLSECGTID